MGKNLILTPDCVPLLAAQHVQGFESRLHGLRARAQCGH